MFAGNPEVNQVIGSFIMKSAYTALVGGLVAIILWPLKFVKKEWVAMKEQLRLTHAELENQRTNCLATLQSQGSTQIELLKDSVKTLGDIRVELAKQTGFLQASAPKRSRTRKK